MGMHKDVNEDWKVVEPVRTRAAGVLPLRQKKKDGVVTVVFKSVHFLYFLTILSR
jgi:hypothetical protein